MPNHREVPTRARTAAIVPSPTMLAPVPPCQAGPEGRGHSHASDEQVREKPEPWPELRIPADPPAV